jgi:hypothetical protein
VGKKSPYKKPECHPLYAALLGAAHEDLSESIPNAQNDLEQNLFHCFQREDAESLKLPLFLVPKIYRKLPRLYHKEFPDTWKIKSNFADLFFLKKHFIDKAVLYLYQPTKKIKPLRIVLFTWVMSDGFGDFFAQQEAASILREEFCDANIDLVVLVHKSSSFPSFHSHLPLHFVYYSGGKRDGVECEAFSSSLNTILHSADVIIELPTSFPKIDQILTSLPQKPKYERIGEFGLIDRAWFHPKTPARCMGLHFLEKGIYLNQRLMTKPSRWVDLKDSRIKEILFQKIDPSAEDIEHYQTNRRFNLNYTKSKQGQYRYLHILLKALEHDPKPIDICFSQMDHFIENLETKMKSKDGKYPLFEKFHVSCIEICYKGFFSTLKLSKQGKTVRFIHVERLPHEDFLTLFSLTDDLIGCTGDGSFSEALSTGKPFFYDPPYHKRPFLKDLIALMEDRLRDYPACIDFFKNCQRDASLALEDHFGPWVTEDFLEISKQQESDEHLREEVICETMGGLLKNPEFATGIKKLRQIIDEEYCFAPILCQLTYRAALHRRFPEIEKKETMILDSFASGEINAKTALKKIQDIFS